jgi:predicted ATPase
VLKGFSRPVPIWLVPSKGAVRSRFEALHPGALTPFMGRDEELTFLSRRWEQAKRGSGQVILLCGEPGIGKSRLVAELSLAIRNDTHFRLRYFCSPLAQNSPLHPIIGHFEEAASFGPDDTPAERLPKLQRLLRKTDASDHEVALIADLLSIQSDALPTLTLSPQRKRELTAAALNQRLAHLAGERPLLMLFEDAHWCDPSSLELIHTTIDAVRRMPILLVITYRPEFRPPWVGEANVALVTLSRLDREQASAMAAIVAPLSADLREKVAIQSDGIPLFVEELSKSMVDCDTAVPATLQASLISRLDRLPMAKQAAQIGSAIGREFHYSLLAPVADIPAPTLLESLDEIVAAGLVVRRGDPPDAVYTFKHALMQDAAYETMLRSRRADIHARILHILSDAELETEETQLPILAHHAERAGLVPRAVRYLLHAAQQSAERSAMAEARANLLRGQSLIADIVDLPERQLLEAELQVALSNVQIAMLGFGADAQGTVLAHALELCRGLDPHRPERATLLSRTLYGEWSYRLHTGSTDGAHAVAQEFSDLGRDADDSDIRLMAATTFATSLFLEGNLRDSHVAFARASSDHARQDDRASSHGFAVDAATLFDGQFSRLLACLGLAADARTRADAALRRARELQHLPSIAISLSSTCTTAWVLRDVAALEHRASSLVRLAREQGYAFWEARGRCYAGWTAAQTGRLDQAVELLTAGISALRSSSVTLYLPSAHVMLAEVYQLRGETAAAMRALEEASNLVARTGECWCEAEIYRATGGLRRDDPATAEPLLQRAMTLARRRSSRVFELRAALDLARLWTTNGRRLEARSLLAPLRDELLADLDFADLPEARGFLLEL